MCLRMEKSLTPPIGYGISSRSFAIREKNDCGLFKQEGGVS
jgi:hypothetical protein